MIKKTALFLAAVFLICALLSSCAKGDGKDAQTADAVTEPADTAQTDAAPKMDIGSYMKYFVNFFHGPYKAGDDLSGKDILYLCFEFAFTEKERLDFVSAYDFERIILVKGEELRRCAKTLFGDGIALADFNHFTENGIDEYADTIDTYVISYDRDDWGGDPFYLDEKTGLQITETDNTLTVVATVFQMPDAETLESVHTWEYVFDKVEEDNFMFYRIQEIRAAK